MDTDNLCARLASLMRRVGHAEAEALVSEAIATIKWQEKKIAECSQLWAEQTAARAKAEAALGAHHAAHTMCERRVSALREERDELLAWQEKVCAIVQPAENADEWGADVADIIAMRERERLALRKELKTAIVWIDDLPDRVNWELDDPSAPTTRELLPQLRAALKEGAG